MIVFFWSSLLAGGISSAAWRINKYSMHPRSVKITIPRSIKSRNTDYWDFTWSDALPSHALESPRNLLSHSVQLLYKILHSIMMLVVWPGEKSLQVKITGSFFEKLCTIIGTSKISVIRSREEGMFSCGERRSLK